MSLISIIYKEKKTKHHVLESKVLCSSQLALVIGNVKYMSTCLKLPLKFKIEKHNLHSHA